VALCLYELSRDSRAASTRPEPSRPAKAAATEQVSRLLLEALERSGYVNPRTAGSTGEKVRRLVRRLNLSAKDAPVVLGMLRQILWKVGE
jgi:tRNA C32,U32 (ribose-2'-O)-methylase TrmJ